MLKIKKYCIKIPKDVSILYLKKKNILILKANKNLRFLVAPQKLNLIIFKNKILICISFLKIPNSNKKKLMYLQKNVASKINQFLIEIKVKIYSKLRLVGIGYKIFKTSYRQILMLKLGYSHSLYFKLNVDNFIIKSVKLFIMGNSYVNLMKISALIKALRLPEPYKGKGILYDSERIKIKVGKKI
jgi:large subunit ribosomal protein L6